MAPTPTPRSPNRLVLRNKSQGSPNRLPLRNRQTQACKAKRRIVLHITFQVSYSSSCIYLSFVSFGFIHSYLCWDSCQSKLYTFHYLKGGNSDARRRIPPHSCPIVFMACNHPQFTASTFNLNLNMQFYQFPHFSPIHTSNHATTKLKSHVDSITINCVRNHLIQRIEASICLGSNFGS